MNELKIKKVGKDVIKLESIALAKLSKSIDKDFVKAVKESAGDNWKIGSIERQEFYKEAKKSHLIVSTSETRPYGCFILTKGVIKPDGSVWVLDK